MHGDNGDSPRACTRADHNDLKRSPAAFVAGTSHRYLWEMLSESGERMVGARCARCHTDLAVTVRAGVSLTVIERLFDVDVSAARDAVAEVA